MNPIERRLAQIGPGDTYVCRLEVSNPWKPDAMATLNFAFLKAEETKDGYYILHSLRVQDHLRKMGLGHGALRAFQSIGKLRAAPNLALDSGQTPESNRYYQEWVRRKLPAEHTPGRAKASA